MKTRLLFSLLAVVVPTLAAAGEFTGNWWTFDGGAGVSSGVTYRLQGTIGQPDVGVSCGVTYALNGGFWPGAIPQPPKLIIELLPDGSVKVSWPKWASDSDYELRWWADVTTNAREGWNTVPPDTYQTDGTCWSYIIVPDPVDSRFYTLAKQCP
jgi:hypothetical protein